MPLAPDDQLALLKIKQGHRIYLGSLVLPGELPNPKLSFLNVVTPQPLEPLNNVAKFSEIGIFLIWSWLIRQGW